MPDVTRCGGPSELKRIATMAEAYNARHGEYPSRNSVESWLSVMLVAAATEAIGEFDQQKFCL